MTVDTRLGLLYALGTFATWAAIVFGVTTFIAFIKLISRQPGVNPAAAVPAAIRDLVLTLVFATIGFLLTKPVESGNLKVPIVWAVMPWTAWIFVAALLLGVARLIQAFTAISAAERASRLQGVGLCVVSALVMAGLYRLDDKNKVEILKGGIQFTYVIFAIVVLLAGLAVAAMVLTANSAKARGLGKTIVTQAALLAGSFVFGLPFVFLLVTSFKEDVDMSSKSGIVWIPKVTETVPFISTNDEKKHYETEYEGQTVEGLIIGREGNNVKIDIFRPLAIRGITFNTTMDKLKAVPVQAKVYTAKVDGVEIKGFEEEGLSDGSRILQIMTPSDRKGQRVTLTQDKTTAVRHVGLRYQNYPEALDYLPPETLTGLVYLKNTLILVVMNVIGTILSSSIVAYGFSRLQFPGKEKLFGILLATMMLPAAVTMLPKFLIFRTLGWVDTLFPLWATAFFGSAFNIFLLRQFFSQIPMELEDAAKIDGCGYLKTFWNIMIPQIKPALAVIAIWTFMGAWNDFQGPLIYINSPENMPLSYALALFKGDRSNEPGLLMAFSTLTVIPVIGLFAFAQKYFIEGVTLSGLGGR